MTHLRHPRLSGLGRNPAAPQDVLVRVAAHEAGRHGMALRRGQLPDSLVAALLASGDVNAAISLDGDRISPGMRHQIAQHPDPAIRNARADFIRGMVDRRVRPGIEEIEEAYRQSRTTLINSPDPRLRAAVAHTWHDRPLAAQVRLLADPDPLVRAAATMNKHPGIPAGWRDRCLADPATRINAARYVPLTAKQALELIATGDADVCRAVAGNPTLPAEAVTALLDVDDPCVRVAVALTRHVDAATRQRLYALVEAEYAAGSMAADVALHWNGAQPDWLLDEPLAVRLTYLDCRHPVFRCTLARCRDLPDEAWQRLDNDPNLGVRRTAADRPDTPATVLEQLVRDGGERFHIRPLLVEHPNFPRHRLRTLADDPDPHLQYVALQDPELPAEVLVRLATSPQPWLRRGVAGHPNATGTLLEQLLADPDPEVADEAAANPTLPQSWMYRILAEEHL